MKSENRLNKEIVFRSLSWVQSSKGEYDPVEINETIHDLIEEASWRSKKTIWKLSPIAANILEKAYLTQSRSYLRDLVNFAVLHSKHKILHEEDVSLAHYFMNSFCTKTNTV